MRRLIVVVIYAATAGGAAAAAGRLSLANVTSDEVTKAMAKAGLSFASRPGRWELTVHQSSFQMDGMPPSSSATRGNLPPTRLSVCATGASSPVFELFRKAALRCRFDSFTMTNDGFDSRMRCFDEKGGLAEVTSKSARLGPDRLSMHVSSSYRLRGKMVKSTSWSEGRRTGACRGDELIKGAPPRLP